MRRYSRFYAPWLRSLLVMGVAVFLLTLLAADAVKQRGITAPMAIAAVLMALAARYGWRDYLRRDYGKYVERRAIPRLASECRKRGWRLEANVPCRSGGDLDALVVAHSGRRFAVEIKAWHGLMLKRSRLVKMNGAGLRKDPIPQCLREAADHCATPVLWLPNARVNGSFAYGGVTIVNGDAEALCGYIGKSS